jgi:hypothetical protein
MKMEWFIFFSLLFIISGLVFFNLGFTLGAGWQFPEYTLGYIVGILFFISILGILFTVDDFYGEDHTIQDIALYCEENPKVLITPRGDNCSQVMNIIYTENENFKRYIIYK